MLIIGDLHGKKELLYPLLKSNQENYVFLGDFGFVWKWAELYHSKVLSKLERSYNSKNFFVVPGNHENYDAIESVPVTYYQKTKVRAIRSNIFYVERGEVLKLEGKTILCLGGADSVDKSLRIAQEEAGLGKVWWPQEQIKLSDMTKAVRNCGGQVDYVFTHDVPFQVKAEIYPRTIETKSDILLGSLMRQVEYKEWYCGHLHLSYYSDKNRVRVLKEGEVIEL